MLSQPGSPWLQGGCWSTLRIKAHSWPGGQGGIFERRVLSLLHWLLKKGESDD